MTAAALAGFDGKDNPHIYSAPTWYAHELGRYFRSMGHTCPTNVRMGRGYHIRAREMLFRIEGDRASATFIREI